VEERLAEQLDTRVRIEAGRSRGRIVIEFATEADLGRIVDLIDPPPRPADASEWTHSSGLSE
jgi:ParB family chromosome partitioning protein